MKLFLAFTNSVEIQSIFLRAIFEFEILCPPYASLGIVHHHKFVTRNYFTIYSQEIRNMSYQETPKLLNEPYANTKNSPTLIDLVDAAALPKPPLSASTSTSLLSASSCDTLSPLISAGSVMSTMLDTNAPLMPLLEGGGGACGGLSLSLSRSTTLNSIDSSLYSVSNSIVPDSDDEDADNSNSNSNNDNRLREGSAAAAAAAAAEVVKPLARRKTTPYNNNNNRVKQINGVKKIYDSSNNLLKLPSGGVVRGSGLLLGGPADNGGGSGSGNPAKKDSSRYDSSLGLLTKKFTVSQGVKRWKKSAEKQKN